MGGQGTRRWSHRDQGARIRSHGGQVRRPGVEDTCLRMPEGEVDIAMELGAVVCVLERPEGKVSITMWAEGVGSTD